MPMATNGQPHHHATPYLPQAASTSPLHSRQYCRRCSTTVAIHSLHPLLPLRPDERPSQRPAAPHRVGEPHRGDIRPRRRPTPQLPRHRLPPSTPFAPVVAVSPRCHHPLPRTFSARGERCRRASDAPNLVTRFSPLRTTVLMSTTEAQTATPLLLPYRRQLTSKQTRTVKLKEP